jgi:hypothetical protein
MTRKACKRHVRPLLNPIKLAMRGAQSVASNQDAPTLRLTNHSALVELRCGRANDEHMTDLAHVVNMGRLLCLSKKKLGRDVVGVFDAAREAIEALALRATKSGRYVCTGAELNALADALATHDEQLKICDVATLQKAVTKLRGIVRNGKPVLLHGLRGHTAAQQAQQAQGGQR